VPTIIVPTFYPFIPQRGVEDIQIGLEVEYTTSPFSKNPFINSIRILHPHKKIDWSSLTNREKDLIMGSVGTLVKLYVSGRMTLTQMWSARYAGEVYPDENGEIHVGYIGVDDFDDDEVKEKDFDNGDWGNWEEDEPSAKSRYRKQQTTVNPQRVADLKLLGLLVTATATATEIKSRYRELVKKIHPDLMGKGSFTKFDEITKAYKRLVGA